MYLDPATGVVAAAEYAPTAPAGTRAYNILYPLHIGRWGGLPVMILYALLGLAPVALMATGVITWWNRSGRRRFRTR